MCAAGAGTRLGSVRSGVCGAQGFWPVEEVHGGFMATYAESLTEELQHKVGDVEVAARVCLLTSSQGRAGSVVICHLSDV